MPKLKKSLCSTLKIHLITLLQYLRGSLQKKFQTRILNELIQNITNTAKQNTLGATSSSALNNKDTATERNDTISSTSKQRSETKIKRTCNSKEEQFSDRTLLDNIVELPGEQPLDTSESHSLNDIKNISSANRKTTTQHRNIEAQYKRLKVK